MPQTVHEDLLSRAAPGLSTMNQFFDVMGADTYQSASTTLALWTAANNAKAALATVHEDEKSLLATANRSITEAIEQGIYTTTKMAAANTQALAQAGFTSEDPTLAAGLRASRG